MRNRDWAYDTDDTGQKFLVDEIVDEIDEILYARGIMQGSKGYDSAFEVELEKLFKKEEQEYSDYMTDMAVLNKEFKELEWF